MQSTSCALCYDSRHMSEGINIAIAIFNFVIAIATAAAAFAAWSSVNLSKKVAELSKKAAEDGRAQVDKMNEALVDAAKANALATRIEYYHEQVAFGQRQGWNQDSAACRDQQEHLVYQLDEILAKMKVGAGYPCDGSPHNGKIEGWKQRYAQVMNSPR
jgi:hypothetical protein